MEKTFPWLVLLFTAGGLPSLSAATVSVLVVEAGRGNAAGTNEFSLLWENSLMDVLFDEGHIVSNAPVLRLPRRAAEFRGGLLPEAGAEFEEARNGGADYFILALLDYEGAPGRPRSVFLGLFNTRSPQPLLERDYSGGWNGPLREETDRIRDAVRQLAARIRTGNP